MILAILFLVAIGTGVAFFTAVFALTGGPPRTKREETLLIVVVAAMLSLIVIIHYHYGIVGLVTAAVILWGYARHRLGPDRFSQHPPTDISMTTEDDKVIRR